MTTSDGQFLDDSGRRLILRGVNLGGSSKVPLVPNGATHLPAGFFDHRTPSFVGRPLRLSDADAHFARITEWGLSFVRLLVTWEAVEHSGPGLYDVEYLDYLVALVKKAEEHRLTIIVDFHQDVWSRFTGGSGAPGWTLEAAGMRLEHIDETGAAFIHQAHLSDYERMIWSTNGSRLAAATMFTLFFAGNDFAPLLTVAGEPIQEYLQARYLDALAAIAERLRPCANVVGYDPMNEPMAGFVGCRNLSGAVGEPRIGATPTPFQSMALGEGIPQEVDVWRFGPTGSRRRGRRTLNARGLRLWNADTGCPWRRQGVWEIGRGGLPRLLEPEYFASVGGRRVDFDRDYYRPFLARCVARVRAVSPRSLLFLEPSQGGSHVAPYSTEGVASAPHWYDGPVLMLKRFSPVLGADSLRRRVVIGPRRIRRSYSGQLELLGRLARGRMEDAPTLIGETGVPFDLRVRGGRRRRDRTVSAAMERSLRAMDDALASYALWNYTADNDAEHGDQWNGEDLSIYSPKAGGRALAAVVRPYARAVAGRPRRMSFEAKRRRFFFEFDGDDSVSAPTEIFVPSLRYREGFTVRLSDGGYVARPAEQLIEYRPGVERARHWIELRPARP